MRKVLYILGQLSDDDVDWLARAGERQSLPPGREIITQGRAIECLYILLDGRVGVSVEGLGRIAELGSGEIVGEMSLVDSRPPSASVRTLEPTVVLAVTQATLNARLASDQGFAARLYKAIAIFLSSRMRTTVRTLGAAKGNAPAIDDEHEMEDEIDLNVLDNVHRAGARFDRMIKRLMNA
jgi:CRP-like cAMP-binding protein